MLFLITVFSCNYKNQSVRCQDVSQATYEFHKCIQDFNSSYKEIYGDEKFILSAYVESYSIEGLQLALASHPLAWSTIKACSFDQYMVIDSVLLLVYTGQHLLIKPDQECIINCLTSNYSLNDIKDDWDEAKQEPFGELVYTPFIKKYIIIGDSVANIKSTDSSINLHCVPCPLPKIGNE